MCFILNSKEGDCFVGFVSMVCMFDMVNIVFDCKGELCYVSKDLNWMGFFLIFIV